jgi:tripartite-type tricarboxylate transporter receptor subunit TctC
MIARLLIVLAAILCCGTAAAQKSESPEYPTRLITILVPYPAGGAADILTRVVAEKVGERLHQTVIVENRAGATGGLGSAVVAKAEPDGYTLLSTPNAPIVLNPFIQKGLRYDAASFVPVSQLAAAPLVIAVRNEIPAATIQEFIAYAKANPGKLNYGSQGIGSGAHLATLQFQKATGTEMVHIPFTGAAPALQGLASGQIDLFIDNLGTSLSLHQAGQLKILAVGSAERAPELPDVPSLREAGLKDIELTTWFGLFAPPKTPAPIAAKLSQAVGEALKEPEVASRFKTLGLTPAGSTPQDFAKFLAADRARWKTFIEAAKISN